jgi:hypothetical protein
MKMERAGTKGCKNKRTNKPKHNNRSKWSEGKQIEEEKKKRNQQNK